MTPKTILVPVDFSLPSEQGLDYACALAAKLGATLHVVHAFAALPSDVTLSEAMLRSLRNGNEAAIEKLVDPRRALVKFGSATVEEGDPRDVILASAAKLNPDLIVMGTHGRRGLSRMLLGSVAEEVSRRAPCPVLLVRSKEHK